MWELLQTGALYTYKHVYVYVHLAKSIYVGSLMGVTRTPKQKEGRNGKM